MISVRAITSLIHASEYYRAIRVLCWGNFSRQSFVISIGAKPYLQALRAETLVERFAARMHVFVVLDKPGCPGKSFDTRIV